MGGVLGCGAGTVFTERGAGYGNEHKSVTVVGEWLGRGRVLCLLRDRWRGSEWGCGWARREQ